MKNSLIINGIHYTLVKTNVSKFCLKSETDKIFTENCVVNTYDCLRFNGNYYAYYKTKIKDN